MKLTFYNESMRPSFFPTAPFNSFLLQQPRQAPTLSTRPSIRNKLFLHLIPRFNSLRIRMEKILLVETDGTYPSKPSGHTQNPSRRFHRSNQHRTGGEWHSFLACPGPHSFSVRYRVSNILHPSHPFTFSKSFPEVFVSLVQSPDHPASFSGIIPPLFAGPSRLSLRDDSCQET
jgi:hypothetical protein